MSTSHAAITALSDPADAPAIEKSWRLKFSCRAFTAPACHQKYMPPVVASALRKSEEASLGRAGNTSRERDERAFGLR
jgi:hypothetical protein